MTAVTVATLAEQSVNNRAAALRRLAEDHTGWTAHDLAAAVTVIAHPDCAQPQAAFAELEEAVRRLAHLECGYLDPVDVLGDAAPAPYDTAVDRCNDLIEQALFPLIHGTAAACRRCLRYRPGVPNPAASAGLCTRCQAETRYLEAVAP